MDNEYIWIKSKIFLFDNNCGGVERKVKTFYHPNLIFGYNQSIFELYDKSKGRFIFKKSSNDLPTIISKDGLFFIEHEIETGIFHESIIRINAPLSSSTLLKPNSDFLIREGSWVLGLGKVLSQINPSLYNYILPKYY